ncbi:hypothetical protein NTGBS_820019 [Candidatus Nitrotoga sp. BS]|nr:hypothetical protein NTGBS_820019 [Candidatus Nitrotoga sp. BS]
MPHKLTKNAIEDFVIKLMSGEVRVVL